MSSRRPGLSAARWPRAPAHLRAAPHLVVAALCAGVLAALAVAPSLRLALAGVVLALGTAAFALRRGRALVALVAVVLGVGLAGWGWGGWRLAATTPPPLALPAGVTGTVVVDAPPVPDGRGGRRARAQADDLTTPSGPVPAGTRMLLDLPADGAEPPRVGERLRVTGTLRPPAGADAPGWWRAYLGRQRIAARLRPDTVAAAGRREGPAGVRDRWRVWAGANAGAGLSGDVGALVRGMALGGGSGLSEQAADDFRDSGIWHLLAVSGQNVTVVAIAALAGLRGLGVGRRPATLAAIALIGAYCLACDGGASVARAGAVGALGLLAELRSSTRERWYLLLVALAALLAVQPRAIGDPGLQLSFAAVVGLFTIAPPLATWVRGWLPGRAADLVALAAGASLATAPVVVWHFERLSLAGLLLNVVAVPLAAPIVVLALAGIAAGAVLAPAGVALAALAGLGAGLLLGLARVAASLPGAAVDLPPVVALILVPLAIAVPLAARRLGIRRPPPPRRAARLSAAGLAALAVAALGAGWLWLGAPGPGPWAERPALTVLDVGQGDALLLRSPEGGAILVDAGPPGPPAPVLAALHRAGVERLDVVAFTHPALDHMGGLAEVVAAMPVGLVVHPPLPTGLDHPPTTALLRDARARGIPTRAVRAGDALRAGAWRVRVLWPERAPPPGADPNLTSLVATASAGGLDVLLTADAESPTLAPLAPRVATSGLEVLKVGHHGSEDAGLADLLARLRPDVAMISVGEGNPFGHPRPQVLQALAAAGVPAWRTDRSGDLTVTGGEGAVAVAAAR